MRRGPAARDDDRWDCLETREGPTRGRSANRACQLASSWSRNDHEDGGPTIQLPAAEAAAPFDLSATFSIRGLRPSARPAALQRCPWSCWSAVQSRPFRGAPKLLQSTSSWPLSTCTRSVLLVLAPSRPAVRDIAFSVESGEIFGFLGPSGAGKSTTQNVLIRLLDGYDGNVTVLGRDLRAGTEATTVELASRSRPRTTI